VDVVARIPVIVRAAAACVLAAAAGGACAGSVLSKSPSSRSLTSPATTPAPDPRFQALVRQAQAAGVAVLGYSSTNYAQRPIGSVETEVRQCRAWYGVNGIFLDVIQGTTGELPHYRALASYIRATVPDAVIGC
jgi:hypothetical protein